MKRRAKGGVLHTSPPHVPGKARVCFGTSRYFKETPALSDGAPPPAPLLVETSRVVRFSETDPLNIVWHGRYASYFEDARFAFGKRYGLGYESVRKAGFLAPIKRMVVDYEASLRFGLEYRIAAALFWSDAARLNFEYEIRDMSGRLMTHGCTVQLFLDSAGVLQYVKPPFYEEFCLLWRKGAL
jgi:acyl-CoA thioester hydrolase